MLIQTLNQFNLEHYWKPTDKPKLIIGDIHGCANELIKLIDYSKSMIQNLEVILVGDLFDRGPHNKEVFDYVKQNNFKRVMGNHCDKLMRYCKNNPVHIGDGLQETIDQINLENPRRKLEMLEFLTGTPEVIEEELFQVVHACPYSPRMFGEKKEFEGEKIRFNWWDFWKGKLTIYGHYWFDQIVITSNTIGIDTSCVIGGSLTGVILPHGIIVSVAAEKNYLAHNRKTLELFEIEKRAWEYWKNTKVW
jgi:protein phosphatase